MTADPQSISAALALAKAFEQAIAPIFVALVIGTFGWMSWVTWGLYQIKQACDGMKVSVDSTLVLAIENKTNLTDHRIEDTDHFARVDERIRSLTDREQFWQKVAEDRARVMSS